MRLSFRLSLALALGFICACFLARPAAQAAPLAAAHAERIPFAQASRLNAPASTQAVFDEIDTSAAGAPLCRFGVNGDVRRVDSSPLRVGWYVDYNANNNPTPPAGVEYMPMLRLIQTGPSSYRYSFTADRFPFGTESGLNNLIASAHGGHIYIGNEPDRVAFQDDMEPKLYAVAYHDLYYYIKQRDPSIKVIAGAIVQPTPLRLRYLDRVLNAYGRRYHEPMPVDIWSIHNFILNEASCDHFDEQNCWGAGIPPGSKAIEGLRVGLDDNDRFDLFTAQILRFRQWLYDRGYRGAAVYLSEYGVLMPEDYASGYPPARVNAFMTKTFDFMRTTRDAKLGDPADDNRLIERFSWYSIDEDTTYNGDLYTPVSLFPLVYKQTAIGEHYSAYTAPLADATDFVPVRLTINPPAPLSQAGNVTFTLTAAIGNAGSVNSRRTVVVRFYDGNPAAGGVQIGTDQQIQLLGCGDRGNVQVTWPNIAPGPRRIYVVVDPDQIVFEAKEDNNQLSGRIAFFTQQIFLPNISTGLPLP